MRDTSRRAKPTPADLAAAERLRSMWAARARHLGLTQDKVAATMDGTQGLVSQYINGKIPLNYRALLVFADALGVAPSDIRNDLAEQRLTGPSDEEDWANVPGYPQGVAMGDGALPEEYGEAHKLKFRATSLRKQGLYPRSLAVYYGKGDSMQPRIHDGDAVLFDTSDTTPKDDRIFVVQHGGHLLAKRLQQLGGRWFLVSDNREDPKWRKPVPIDEDGFEIVGRVRWIGSWEA